MKNCSYCGRDNADATTRCQECGTALGPEPEVAEPFGPPTSTDAARAAAGKKMSRGALACSAGILVTVVSYFDAVSSPFGGTYIIAWGAILFGAVQFIQGWRSREAAPSREDFGYEALAEATRLETEGFVSEALTAYQKVIAEYPGTDAGHDAQKSLESLKAKLG